MKTPEWIKPGIWGGVIGAVAIVIIGFSAGWVVSGSSAKEMANSHADKAVLAALTPICVAQFQSATKAQAATITTSEDVKTDKRGVLLAALKKEDSWKRDDFVKKQGWATMPGSTDPNSAVASACADELMKITAKMDNK